MPNQRRSAKGPIAEAGMRPRDTLAARLTLLRRDLGLRERGRQLACGEVAERCGLNGATWIMWERGSIPQHAEMVLRHVANTLGFDAEWLLFGGELEATDEQVVKQAS